MEDEKNWNYVPKKIFKCLTCHFKCQKGRKEGYMREDQKEVMQQHKIKRRKSWAGTCICGGLLSCSHSKALGGDNASL